MAADINIVLCINDAYVPFVGPLVRSLADCHPDSSVEVHILSDNISAKSKRRLADEIEGYPGMKITHYEVDDSPLEGLQAWSKYTWYRLLITHVLPADIHRALYLDADTLVCENLMPLFSMDLEGKSVAGVIDPMTFHADTFTRCGYPAESGYICAGVLLINLDFWRAENLAEKMIAWAKKHPDIKYHDQDVINRLCHDTKLELPLKYGLIDCLFLHPELASDKYIGMAREAVASPAIIHYAGTAPWFADVPVNPWSHRWHAVNRSLRHPAHRKYKAKFPLSLKIRLHDLLHPGYIRRYVTDDDIHRIID